MSCPPVTVDVTVEITGGDLVVQEGAGSVLVCVTLDHVPLVPVAVTISSSGMTAQSEILNPNFLHK